MENLLKEPLPLEKSNEVDNKRLWVGNLDPRISEYNFLKIVQKPGNIEKLDFLFHRSGPQAGQPRGYAFVTYKTEQDANHALQLLHNLKVGSKSIVVRYAHSVNTAEMEKPKPKIEIPALAGAKKNDCKISKQTAIQAIEAKLKMMKESEEEFEINKPLAGSSLIYQYQKPETSKLHISKGQNSRTHHHNKKPYYRPKIRR